VTIIFDPKESILDNILGDDHVGLTILYYLGNISIVMTIWKWLLAQTTMEGFSLKELLLSYDESCIPKVDVEGMISMKGKQKEIVSLNSISRIEKVLKEESCHGVGAMMCSSLNYCQHFSCQMTRLLRHEF
jgi:hypothetical protein